MDHSILPKTSPIRQQAEELAENTNKIAESRRLITQLKRVQKQQKALHDRRMESISDTVRTALERVKFGGDREIIAKELELALFALNLAKGMSKPSSPQFKSLPEPGSTPTNVMSINTKQIDLFADNQDEFLGGAA